MPQTNLEQSIRSQIKALQFALMQANHKPTVNIYAIKGKIKKLEKQLDELKTFNWLAQ